ncbi:polysaccharide deacetylase family protein [Nitratifractor sp.]
MQSKGKMLFLTFDDGPVNGTQNLLRILREEGVPATMFFIGNHVQKRPGLFHLAKSNPELLIANHTYWHAHGHYQRFYSDAWNVLSDVEHAQLTIGGRKYLRLAGRDVWRLPEVRRDDYALSPSVRMRERPKYDALADDGFFIFGWDVEWRFDPVTGHPLFGPEALARKIDWIARHHRTKLRGKVILLAHDFMFRTQGEARMLRRFIRLMKQRGWHFATIERYSSRKPDVMRIARYYGHPRRSVLVRNDHAIHPDAGTSANATRSSRNDRNALASLIPQTSNGDGALSPSMRPLHLSRAQWLQIRLNDAVLHYRANEVDRLLRAGAKPNRVDRYGRVAINTAIRANSMVLVRKLLRSGAIPTVKDAMGRDALQTARFYRRGAILSYLTHILHPAQAKRLAAAEQLPQTIRTPNAGASADIPSPASVPAVQPTLHRDPLQILR